MAAFGSFALLIALALAAYNLLAGALALRLIATGQPARDFAGAAGRYGAPGRNRRLCGRHRGRLLRWSGRSLPTIFPSPTSWSTRTARCPGPTSLRAVERAGGSLLLWAWLLGTYGFVLRLTHKTT
jgi:cytochrome c-type biogenesis protein CcmF